MYLYFNGDSFVAGSELGDDILPEYPGLSHFTGDKTQFTEWFKKTRGIHDVDITKRIAELEYKRSFPAKIADKLNSSFINKARGGSSMDRIARTTIADLINLKRNNTDNIVAIIGTTGWGRSEFPVRKKDSDKKNTWQCILPSIVEHIETSEIEHLRKYKISNESDYHHAINFYKNIILVQDFCKLNDIRLFWVATYTNPTTNTFDVLQKYEDYADYKEYANLNYAVDLKQCAEIYFKGQPIVCPGGHFGEPVHDVVADKLTEMIR